MSRRRSMLLLLVALLAVSALMLGMQATMSDGRLTWTFSEAGPFERLSEWFWLLAAGAAMVLIRPLRWRSVSVALICVAAAAREADLHAKLTHDSITKINYYLAPGFPLWERVLAAVAALAIIALVAELLIAAVRFAIEDKFFDHAWSCVAAICFGLVVALKVLDRSNAFLEEKFAIDLPETVAQTISVLEEGLECALPLVVLYVMLLARQAKQGATAVEPQPATAGESA